MNRAKPRSRTLGSLLFHDSGRRIRKKAGQIATRWAGPDDFKAARDVVRKLNAMGASMAQPRLALREHSAIGRVRTLCCRQARINAWVETVVADVVGRDHAFCRYCWDSQISRPLRKKGVFLSYTKPAVFLNDGAEVEGYTPRRGAEGATSMAKNNTSGLESLPDVDDEEVGGDMPGFLDMAELKSYLRKKGADKTTATITKDPRESEYGFTVDLKLPDLGARSLTLRVKDGEPSLNLKRCVVMFGKTKSWVGRKITLAVGTVRTGEFKGNEFLRVEPVPKK